MPHEIYLILGGPHDGERRAVHVAPQSEPPKFLRLAVLKPASMQFNDNPGRGMVEPSPMESHVYERQLICQTTADGHIYHDYLYVSPELGYNLLVQLVKGYRN